jgi:hypothetical protein
VTFHADLLAQIASGIHIDMMVLVVPTPPEIGEAYGVAAGRRSASGAETWDALVAASTANPDRLKLSRGRRIYASGTTGRGAASEGNRGRRPRPHGLVLGVQGRRGPPAHASPMIGKLAGGWHQRT